MNGHTWTRRLAALVLAFAGLQLAACGAGDGGSGQPSGAGTTNEQSAAAAAGPGSAELIDAALAQGTIDAETALSYKVFALFRDARLPQQYRGATDEESASDLLQDASAGFGSLSPAAQQALAPFLRRPADLGSWTSPGTTGSKGLDRGVARRANAPGRCQGQDLRWTAATPAAGAKVKVWYDSTVAGDQALAVATSQAIDDKVWPGLMAGSGAAAAPGDASTGGCDGGDARLDVYLVHGIQARELIVPAAGSGLSAVFVLVNADVAAQAPGNAAQGVMNAVQHARRVAAGDAGTDGRKQALARRTAGSATVAAAVAAALPQPTVMQGRSASLSSRVVAVTLDSPVSGGNWIAVALSTMGTSPANVVLSDNQARTNLGFASAGLKAGTSFGTVWRYVRLTSSGPYTLTVDRAKSTSGSVHVFELGNVDPTTFLDVAAVGASGISATAAATLKKATRTNDLLLSVVSVRSGSATITPTLPTGTAVVANVPNSQMNTSVMAFNTSALVSHKVAAAFSEPVQWRVSALAVRGAAAPPVVIAPVNTALPVVTVTDQVTHLRLTASSGAWANDPTELSHGWLRNGVPIADATGSSYDTTTDDQGTSIAAVVTASNSAGSASATSTAVPVPVLPPGPPSTPAVALTATPQSVMQGQPSTLAWTSTSATSCLASGAWSGTLATSGTQAVTPAASSSYQIDCTGPGGSATASATVDVTFPPPGSAPTLGAHALVFHVSKGSVGPWLSTPPLTTQSGSTVLTFVGKGSIWNLAPTIDNKGNSPYVQVGPIHEYTNWPGEGTTIYAFNSIVGGPDHIFSVNDSNVWDEVTFSVVEVRNGGVIQDHKWNEVLKSPTQTSLSVTTTGPATLVAVWYGDDSSSTPSNPVPNNGFTVNEGNGNATESVQMFVATKDVAAAGTYNVTWTTTPVQGAQLYLIAVQKK